jgi:uncharacterized protein
MEPLPNSELPATELLDATHRFPCKYMIKAIGVPDDDFLGRVVAAVRLGAQYEFDPPYSVKETRGGRHISVTLEPVVDSAEQVLEIYRCVKVTAGLVMLW